MGFGLGPSSNILKNTKKYNVRKLDKFPSSDEGLGGGSWCGSVGKK
jgi:hypothetical protein